MMIEGIEFGGTAKILSVHLLKLAKGVIIGANRKHKAARRQGKNVELDSLLEVYILVAASLEAFINEFCREKIDELKSTDREAYWLMGLEAIIDRKIEVRLKWQIVPQLLWQKTFDESKAPWQDFHVLINIRNSLLHYQMEYLQGGRLPKYLGHIQQFFESEDHNVKAPTIIERIQRSETWVDRICHLDVAKWAFNTGIEMIQKFLDFADSETKSQYTWLLEGSGISPFQLIRK
jgi:hypothetical protein